MELKNYRYVGTDPFGKNVKGTVEATSRATCIRLIEQKNISIIKVEEYSNILTKLNSISFGAVIKPKYLSFFLQQLGSLLTAGIKLVDALDILALQEKDKNIRKILMALQQEVYNGNKFSDALAMFPNDFPPLLLSMVEVGEASGDLGNIIVKTADHFEKQRRISSKVKSIVKSPAIYICLALLVAVGMAMFVFPSMSSMYESFDTGELPGVTKMFMAFSDLLLGYWPIIFGSLALLITTFIILKKKCRPFREKLDVFVLKVPVIGSLNQMLQQIMIASTLSQLLSRGVNSLQSLEITKKVCTNSVYEKIIAETAQNVQDGRSFAKAFQESWAIDPIMSRMIATGEKTSEIPKLMTNLSGFYDQTSEAKADQLKAVLQPIMMLVVYAIVACLLLAIMLPELQMGGNMNLG